MGGGQGKAANGAENLDAVDHTPIFRCFDELEAEQGHQFKEQVASFFSRATVPSGASIFEHKIGRRDLVIVEKGELHMVSCHGEKNKKDLNAAIAKLKAQLAEKGSASLLEEEEARARAPGKQQYYCTGNWEVATHKTTSSLHLRSTCRASPQPEATAHI